MMSTPVAQQHHHGKERPGAVTCAVVYIFFKCYYLHNQTMPLTLLQVCVHETTALLATPTFLLLLIIIITAIPAQQACKASHAGNQSPPANSCSTTLLQRLWHYSRTARIWELLYWLLLCCDTTVGFLCQETTPTGPAAAVVGN
jgi:hypothetical protein